MHMHWGRGRKSGYLGQLHTHVRTRAPTSSMGSLHCGDCETCVSLCFTGQRKETLTPKANLPVWLDISPSTSPWPVRPELWLQLFEGGQFISLCSLTTNCTPPTQTPGARALLVSGGRGNRPLGRTVTGQVTHRHSRAGAAQPPLCHNLPSFAYCLRPEEERSLSQRWLFWVPGGLRVFLFLSEMSPPHLIL